jgi:thiamine-phosphate pyrophosphorylase
MKLPRLYPILDSSLLARRGIAIVDVADAFLSAGVAVLQLRQKGQVTRASLADLDAVAALCRSANVPLVVNDRADLARMVGAALHLGREDLPPAAARRVVGLETTIGFSTHNETQLRAAAEEPVDYLALGPIFGTSSKENPDPVVGVEEFRRLRSLTSRPLVAIGGITRSNAQEVFAAGADSIAIIGDLIPEDGSIKKRILEWISLCR